jgi:hypothetical protein
MTASDAPFASVTETRANPAPSGFQADCRRRSARRPAADEPGEGRAAERLQRACVARAALRPRSIRAVRRKGNRSAAVSVAAIVRRVLAQMAQGGGRSALMLAVSTPFGGLMISTSRPSRSKASNRISAAGLAADEAGRRAVVGPADGRRSSFRDRSRLRRVAEAVGGARLECDAAA